MQKEEGSISETETAQIEAVEERMAKSINSQKPQKAEPHTCMH